MAPPKQAQTSRHQQGQQQQQQQQQHSPEAYEDREKHVQRVVQLRADDHQGPQRHVRVHQPPHRRQHPLREVEAPQQHLRLELRGAAVPPEGHGDHDQAGGVAGEHHVAAVVVNCCLLYGEQRRGGSIRDGDKVRQINRASLLHLQQCEGRRQGDGGLSGQSELEANNYGKLIQGVERNNLREVALLEWECLRPAKSCPPAAVA